MRIVVIFIAVSDCIVCFQNANSLCLLFVDSIAASFLSRVVAIRRTHHGRKSCSDTELICGWECWHRQYLLCLSPDESTTFCSNLFRLVYHSQQQSSRGQIGMLTQDNLQYLNASSSSPPRTSLGLGGQGR